MKKKLNETEMKIISMKENLEEEEENERNIWEEKLEREEEMKKYNVREADNREENEEMKRREEIIINILWKENVNGWKERNERKLMVSRKRNENNVSKKISIEIYGSKCEMKQSVKKCQHLKKWKCL